MGMPQNKPISYVIIIMLGAITIFTLLTCYCIKPVENALEIEITSFKPSAIRIDFDDIPSGNLAGDFYLSKGVSFDNARVQTGSYPVSSPNVIVSSNENPITIRFPKGAIRVGIQIDTDGHNMDRHPKMKVFDAKDNLLGNADFGQGSAFVGFKSLKTPIARVELGTTFENKLGIFSFSDAYDNLIFELK